MKRNLWIAFAGVCATCGGFAVLAADHVETPTVTADPAADIADVYIFRPDQSTNRLVAGITFAGRSAAIATFFTSSTSTTRPMAISTRSPTSRCSRGWAATATTSAA